MGDSMLDLYLEQPSIYPVTNLQSDCQTKSRWPYQLPPECISTFKLWQRCIRKLFLSNTGCKLWKPLGAWIMSHLQRQNHHGKAILPLFHNR